MHDKAPRKIYAMAMMIPRYIKGNKLPNNTQAK